MYSYYMVNRRKLSNVRSNNHGPTLATGAYAMLRRLLCCVIVLAFLTGCWYTEEDIKYIESQAAESGEEVGYDLGYEEGYESGQTSGYETGYEDGLSQGHQDVIDHPGEYFSGDYWYYPAGWACVPEEEIEEYEDAMSYYSWMCEYYGLPEYFEGWDKYSFVHYVQPDDDELPRMWHVPGDEFYHSWPECSEITVSSDIDLISKDDAIGDGFLPCPVCCKNEN